MNAIAGAWNAVVCGVLLPATERGNTIAVTAEGPRNLTPWHEASGGRAAA